MSSFLQFGKNEADANVGFRTEQTSKRSRKRNILVCGFLAVLILVVTAILLVIFLTKKETGSTLSPEYQELEADMKKSINPCNDFYEYSCGQYIDRHLPDRSTQQNVYQDKFGELSKKNVQKAKEAMQSMSQTSDGFFKKAYEYYQSCMTAKRTFDTYFTSAQLIGGSDVTTIGTFNLPGWSLEDAIKELILKFHAYPLFTLKVTVDFLNSSRNIIAIHPPDFKALSKVASAEDLEYFPVGKNDELLDNDLEGISMFVSTFARRVRGKFVAELAKRTLKTNYFIDDKVKEAELFEKRVITDLQETFKGVSLRQRYKVISVAQLNNLTNSQINWIGLLGGIFPSLAISINTEVALLVPDSYLSKLSTYVSQYRKKLPNFFALFLLKKLSPALPDDYFVPYYLNGPPNVVDTKGKERWRACLLDTELNLPMSVGMMFTKAAISDKIANETKAMLEEIERSFEEGSTTLTWLDKATKDSVHEKIRYVIDIISGPNLFEAGFLSSAYRQVTSSQNDLAAFFLSCQRNLARMNRDKMTQAPKRGEWDLSSSEQPSLQTVNAFYDRTKNTITILSGILRQPFVYENGPKYLNFAKIGAVLGHELLHGFDSNGRYYDKTGQIAPWWTPASARGFQIRERCLISQYDRYVVAGLNVDGNKTLSENIADNAGLKYAFHAYRKWAAKNPSESKPPNMKSLSQDQLFFIGYAQMWCRAASSSVERSILQSDIHSPNRYRVIGSVSNFPEFGKAFNCPSGSEMNPKDRCLFW